MKNSLSKKEFRLGTRASPLALQQANWVKSRLEEHHPDISVALIHIKTEGDKLEIPLFKVGGKGLFVKEIEEALLRGTIDLAVHSAKDLPAAIPQGLALLAFPEREDPRDALLSREGNRLLHLPPGGKVGTGSLRRKAQLLNLRPDLDVVPLRGNLDTRIRKLSTLNLDAIILAAAGLHRMGWEGKVTEYLDPEVMLPAVGQGVLAVEGREDDERVRGILAGLNHPSTEACIVAERAFLKRLGGGCQVPVAGLSMVNLEILSFSGLVASIDGQRVIKSRIEGSWKGSKKLGEELAEDLLDRGAQEILKEVYAS